MNLQSNVNSILGMTGSAVTKIKKQAGTDVDSAKEPSSEQPKEPIVQAAPETPDKVVPPAPDPDVTVPPSYVDRTRAIADKKRRMRAAKKSAMEKQLAELGDDVFVEFY